MCTYWPDRARAGGRDGRVLAIHAPEPPHSQARNHQEPVECPGHTREIPLSLFPVSLAGHGCIAGCPCPGCLVRHILAALPLTPGRERGRDSTTPRRDTMDYSRDSKSAKVRTQLT